jgi:hypothetical protein
MFETVFTQYAHNRILGEMILLLAPRSLDKQLREERNKPAEVMELDKPVPVEEKKEMAETTSEEFQLFSKISNHVSWGFSLKYCPGNCMFLVCCCAKEMVEVTIADGEMVLRPKQVAIAGYPIFKQFEAQKSSGGKYDANSFGECFFCILIKGAVDF